MANFQTAMSLKAPYLFHGRELGSDENYDLADGTMGVVEEVMPSNFTWVGYIMVNKDSQTC